MTLVSKVKDTLNLDSTVYLSIAGRLWSVLKTPLSVVFITKFLSPAYQGYWYTFLSLGALTVFAELGFTAIITQFISHEFAHLELEKDRSISGDAVYVERLISLVRYSAGKYLYIIPGGMLIILMISFAFFKNILFSKELITIWLVYILSGGLTLIVSLLSSVIQGINEVKGVLKINLIANVLSTLSIWVCLYAGLGIWALSISGIVLALISIIWYLIFYKGFLVQFVKYKVQKIHNWKGEIFKLQIQYSLSWIAGYFIFNFITPVCLYFVGAVVAGKVGITFSATAAILQMAHSWVLNKMPELNMHVSLNRIKDAKSFFISLNKSSLIFFSACSVIVLLVLQINLFNLGAKFMTVSMTAVVLLSEFAKLLFGNWAVYLRSFKAEPFLRISIFNAIFTAIVFYIGLKFWGSVNYSIIAYTIIQFLSLFWRYKIFKNKISQ